MLCWRVAYRTACLNFCGRPGGLFADEFVEALGALVEALGHGFLLIEWPVAVRGVVRGEGDVAQAMEPGCLNVLPVGAEHGAPFGPEVLVLRHDVFDG